MPSYRVTWEIDVDAESPVEAAQKARAIQLNPDSIANVFGVCPGHLADNPHNVLDLSETVDLSELPTKLYQCGTCDHWHKADYGGDCRNDDERFTTDQVEDLFGNEGTGWIETDINGNTL